MESESHKELKNRVSKRYERKGYETKIEHRIPNGLIVDVKAENGEETVFIEIGAMHGEDRVEKLNDYCDEVIQLTQIDKPNSRPDDYTTVSFRKEFVEQLASHLEKTHYDSVKSFLKHLAVKDMESEDKISEEEAREIGKRLEKLGYLDR
jgi:hypothetical protein